LFSLQFARLFAKLPQSGNSKMTFAVFESSYHLLLPVGLSYHSKLLPLKDRSNPVKCLAQEHNKRTCRLIFTLSIFKAERQAGKLWTPTSL